MKMIGWGIGFFIVGSISFLVAAPKMDVIRSGLGMFAAGLSDRMASEFQMWQTVYYMSILIIMVGAVLLIAGVIQQAIRSK